MYVERKKEFKDVHKIMYEYQRYLNMKNTPSMSELTVRYYRDYGVTITKGETKRKFAFW